MDSISIPMFDSQKVILSAAHSFILIRRTTRQHSMNTFALNPHADTWLKPYAAAWDQELNSYKKHHSFRCFLPDPIKSCTVLMVQVSFVAHTHTRDAHTRPHVYTI